jgi:hypothetical protein
VVCSAKMAPSNEKVAIKKIGAWNWPPVTLGCGC